MGDQLHISFRLDHQVDYILREYALFKQMTLSELIRDALLRYIEDDIDPRMFEQNINWERTSTRMKEVQKIYTLDWMKKNSF